MNERWTNQLKGRQIRENLIKEFKKRTKRVIRRCDYKIKEKED
ncbi:MAG: hypothetical protein WBD09_00650 [Halobacteriota archaeon]